MKLTLAIALLATLALSQATLPIAIIIRGTGTWTLVNQANQQRFTGTTSAAGPIPLGTYSLTFTGAQGFDLRVNNVNLFTRTTASTVPVVFALDANGQGRLISPAAPAPAPTPAPTPTRAPGATPSQYTITLVPAAGFNPATQAAAVSSLQAAAARWSQVITGDLPDINGVDDLRITYNFSPIDGRGSTIGSAGPTRLRSGSLLPYEGQMNFDSADIGALSPGEQTALFLHEMGHVLGLGTLWNRLGCSQCEQGVANYDPTGRCPNARTAFEATPGRAAAARLLIEQDGGPGTACGHFDEVQLQSEVMTGFLTVNRATGISEVSTITIGSLRDMGYTVNVAAADRFTVPTSALNRNEMDLSIPLAGDMMHTDMTVDYTDEDMAMGMGDINDMKDDGEDGGLSTGAGIAIGASALVVGGIAVGALLYTRKRNNKGEKHIALAETTV